MLFDGIDLEVTSPHDFWEQRYTKSLSRERGRAGAILQAQVAALAPGRALELGCSTGDDSLWLAEQGWQVTGVDISPAAIQTAKRLAQQADLSHKTTFLALDLSESLPAGQFELITALYFQSPYPDFPRDQILHDLAQQVVVGGHLLVVTHASHPPGADGHDPERVFPTPEAELQALDLPAGAWVARALTVRERTMTRPDGQVLQLQDNLMLLQRQPA